MAWVIDLDGVVFLKDEPIPGAADAVARLRRAGEDVVFVTNNSSAAPRAVEEKLAGMGIPAGGAVVTSAVAAATLVEAGERVLVCGADGLRGEVERRGAIPVREGPADAVVVGYHTDFTYDSLAAAHRAIAAGARFIATNDDATYPTPIGELPGNGAIVAFVARAAGTEPTIAGKPHEPMARVVRDRLGPHGIVVGDRVETDGLFARRIGYRFGLVLTGVTAGAGAGGATDTGDDPGEQPPGEVADEVADDLAALVDRLLS